MPSATSRAIEPVGITSTGARSSLPSRMTEPLPNCRSIWASADSRAFSRFSGEGMVCSLCSRSVACRLSRSTPRVGGDAATRRVVSFDVVHARDGLRHSSSLLTRPVDRHVLDSAVQEPTRASNRCSTTRRGEVSRRATRVFETRQRRRGSRRPTPWRRSRGTSVSSHSASHTSRGGMPASSACAAVRSAELRGTRSATSALALRAELVSDGAIEFASTHRGVTLSAGRVRRRPTRPDRRGRRRGRSECPRARRCGLRLRA